MGGNNSKSGPNSAPNSRRSSRKLSNIDKTLELQAAVKQLELQINKFDGNKSNPLYTTFQAALARNSVEIQELRRSCKKKKYTHIYDNALKNISDALLKLEDRVNSNDVNLDLAAVESTSFINEDVSKFQKQTKPIINEDIGKYQKETRPLRLPPNRKNTGTRIHSLTQIENETQVLDTEIRQAIDGNDTKFFTVLEKKIEILYTDLELIKADPHTPLFETKQKLGEKLVKFNNKIKKAKRISQTSTNYRSSDNFDGATYSRPKQPKYSDPQEECTKILQIEAELGDFEIKAYTFEDTKNDEAFTELDRALKMQWSKLDNLTTSTTENKRNKLKTMDLVKKILQELSKKAEENEFIMKRELGEINIIEKDITKLKIQVEEFHGNKDSTEYLELDQKLRSAWAKLNNVKGTYEKVKLHREKIIKDIQNILKNLNDKVQTPNIEYVQAQVISKPDVMETVEKIQADWLDLQNIIYDQNVKGHISMCEQLESLIKSIQRTIDEQEVVKSRSVISKTYGDRTTKAMDQLISEMSSTKSFDGLENLSRRQSVDLLNDNGFNEILNTKSVDNIYGNVSRNKSFEDDGIVYANIDNVSRTKGFDDLSNTKSFDDVSTKQGHDGSNFNRLLEQVKFDGIASSNDQMSVNRSFGDLPITAGLGDLPIAQSSYNNLPNTNSLENILSAFNSEEDLTIKSVQNVSKPDHQMEVVHPSQTVNLFGAIQKIQREIETIKEEIKMYKGTKENEKYFDLESALNKNKMKLEEINYNSNTVTNAKTKANKKIHEALHMLEEKVKENQLHKSEAVTNKIKHTSLDRNSSAQKLDEIMEIDAKVARLDKHISSIASISHKEINDITKSLSECEHLLENIDAEGKKNLSSSKKEVLAHIIKLQAELKTKSKSDENINELKEIVHRVMKIKKKVDGFYGTYKNVQYIQLEDELQSCLSKINSFKDSSPKIAATKEQLTQKINQYLRFLDERSLKTKPPTSGYTQIDQIRNEIMAIKARAEKFVGGYNDVDYNQIEDDLFKCNDDLNLLNDEGHQSLMESRMQYKDYIKDLLSYLEAKSKHSITQSVGLPVDEEEITLQKIKKQVDILKNEINNFVGVKDDENFIVLDTQLMDLMVDLDRLKVNKNVTLKQTRKTLMRDLNKCAMMLDTKANEVNQTVDSLQEIEQSALALKKEIYSFIGTKNDTTWIILNDRLSNLTARMDDIKTPNESLKEIHKNLMTELNRYAQILHTAKTETACKDTNKLLDQIAAISKDLLEINVQIENFTGFKHDDNHTYLDEYLINSFLKLDNIDPHGDEDVKKAKQIAVREIQRNMQLLDKKVVNRRNSSYNDLEGTEV